MNQYGAGMRRDLKILVRRMLNRREPYTIAMVTERIQGSTSGFEFMILGTDISTKVLERAAKAVYRMERAETVPAQIKKKYLLRSKDREKNLVKIAPEVSIMSAFAD